MSSELVTYFTVWYVGNIAYNEYNKGAAHSADADKTKFAMTIATAQLAVGAVYAIFMWITGSWKSPKITSADIMKCIPAAPEKQPCPASCQPPVPAASCFPARTASLAILRLPCPLIAP